MVATKGQIPVNLGVPFALDILSSCFSSGISPLGQLLCVIWQESEGKKVYTKGVFSSENSSASTDKKEVWCIPKSLFSREKERKYIYTKDQMVTGQGYRLEKCTGELLRSFVPS